MTLKKMQTIPLFADYKLLRRLGSGGMAEVFLAQKVGPLGFLKTFALKRILPHLAEDAELVAMFVDEALLAAKLQHPNIVQTFELGIHQNIHYMTLEYIAGVNLWHLPKADLTVEQVLKIGQQIASALAYAHTLTDDSGELLEIVHRDVSPHNIMVSEQGDIKLLDFGIAKMRDAAKRTHTGMIKGKIAYMAPEQARGEIPTALSDQYALGIILWEFLAKRRLFQASCEAALILQVADGKIEPLENVSSAVNALVMQALQRDPHLRFASMTNMLQAFEECLALLPKPKALSGIVEQVVKPVKTRTLALKPVQTVTSKFNPRLFLLLSCLLISVILFFVSSKDAPKAALQIKTTLSEVRKTELPKKPFPPPKTKTVAFKTEQLSQKAYEKNLAKQLPGTSLRP